MRSPDTLTRHVKHEYEFESDVEITNRSVNNGHFARAVNTTCLSHYYVHFGLPRICRTNITCILAPRSADEPTLRFLAHSLTIQISASTSRDLYNYEASETLRFLTVYCQSLATKSASKSVTVSRLAAASFSPYRL
ncbi:c3.2 [Ichnoviriform fugitivi]|uniref:C3.2 n=1 Tax=Ichnoviriform fugitivi TaxID=265522 RepID=A2Q0G1_9VIRU|nr:c3.2 [Ichnoviriform fugitivi]BAF45676.1 c3.2 [Ichnoviriform fugitivi]